MRFISHVLWQLERIYFYPKLTTFYKSLNLSDNLKNNIIEPEKSVEFIIFDVGAHRGQSAKYFKKIYPEAKIFSFEPSPSEFTKLNRQIIKKKLRNVEAFNIGIADTSGTLNFYQSIFSESSTFKLPNASSQHEKMKNRILLLGKSSILESINTIVSTLDDFVAHLGIQQINILKIDVEGFELEVIKGAKDLLHTRKIQCIQLETHSDDQRVRTDQEIERILIGYGFEKAKSIRHPYGNFYDRMYLLN